MQKSTVFFRKGNQPGRNASADIRVRGYGDLPNYGKSSWHFY